MPSGVLSTPAPGLGARIRGLRENHELTQKQLAEKVGTRANRVSDWEVGRHEPTLVSLEKLAAAFGTTVAELLTDIEGLGSVEMLLLQRIAEAHELTVAELLTGVM